MSLAFALKLKLEAISLTLELMNPILQGVYICWQEALVKSRSQIADLLGCRQELLLLLTHQEQHFIRANDACLLGWLVVSRSLVSIG